MTDKTPVDEIDVLAYADGLLDADPARKTQVEEELRSSPEAMARALIFREQTQALRAAYDRRIEDPIPERLHAALDSRAGGVLGRALPVVVTFCLAFATGVGGWKLGQEWEDDGSAAELIEQSYAEFATAPQASTAPSGSFEGHLGMDTKRAVTWPSEEFSLTLPVPDLSASGYALVDERPVVLEGEQMVRLDYAAPDGRAFSLFLAPRWETPSAEVVQSKRDGMSLVHWLEGPLASTVVATMSPEETRKVAEVLRRTIDGD